MDRAPPVQKGDDSTSFTFIWRLISLRRGILLPGVTGRNVGPLARVALLWAVYYRDRRHEGHPSGAKMLHRYLTVGPRVGTAYTWRHTNGAWRVVETMARRSALTR
jgi:hypothetical protein